jgi:pimeloyl-ACP methyl ester carboxylesterase
MASKINFAILFLVLLLAACGSAPAKIKLSPCQAAGRSALCGKLTVYEDRAAGKGRKIDLKIAVIKSVSPSPAADPIFYLSGGPGVAATEDDGNIAFLAPYFHDRDLVLIDQRGTGGSHAVNSPTAPDWSGLSPAEMETAFAKWMKVTIPKLDMDPRFYTTTVAMQDLDQVRQVLGYDKINLYGGSYGSTAAQFYLADYPQYVRSLVSISGSLLNVPVWEQQAAHAQQALDGTFTRCEADPACSQAFPNVRSEFKALLERLATQPVTLNTGQVILTPELFAAKVEDLTRDARGAALLPHLFHLAYADNDWTYFAASHVGDWTQLIMGYSIQCNEGWAAFQPDETARLGAGSYLLGWNLSRAKRFSMICKYLPKGVTSPANIQQPHASTPVLLFNGQFDPLDPPENVTGSQELWPNSLALTLPWQGHALSDYSTLNCMGSIIQAFVEEGSTAGLDTTCLQNLQPPPFDTRK